MSDDLVAFLRACLDEDDQVARATGALHRWVATDDAEVYEVVGDLSDPSRCEEHEAGVPNMCSDLLVARGEDITDQLDTERAAHIARHDPARVLAEVAAKRRIIDLHEQVPGTPRRGQENPPATGCKWCNEWDGLTWAGGVCETVRLLASVYAGRPGWREEWAADEEATR